MLGRGPRLLGIPRNKSMRLVLFVNEICLVLQLANSQLLVPTDLAYVLFVIKLSSKLRKLASGSNEYDELDLCGLVMNCFNRINRSDMNMCIVTMLWSISPGDQELVFGKLWHIGEWFMQAREWYAVAEKLEKELSLFITTNLIVISSSLFAQERLQVTSKVPVTH